MIERQCLQENDFTLKILGYLYFEKEHFMKELLKIVLPSEDITSEIIKNTKIVFFSRIAENLIRELSYRYNSSQLIVFERKLVRILGFPEGTSLPKNKRGKLLLISKWRSDVKSKLAKESNIPLTEIDFIQKSFNTEPDICIDCTIGKEKYLILIEVKLLSDEGQQQLKRQTMIGKIFSELFILHYKNVFIAPDWCKLPSSKNVINIKFSQIVEWFNHKPSIKEEINNRHFYYKGAYRTIANKNVGCSSDIGTIYDDEDILLLEGIEGSATPNISVDLESNINDEWNIKYLTDKFFIKIYKLWKSSGLNNEIETIGLGKTGTPFKLGGRPNWMVTLKNKDTYTNRYGFSNIDKYNISNLIFIQWGKITTIFNSSNFY